MKKYLFLLLALFSFNSFAQPNFNYGDSIVMMNQNPQKRLIFFGDPNCPYTKEMQRELGKIKNIQVNLFLFPITSQESKDQSIHIWCSTNQAMTWQRKVFLNENAQPKNCNNPIDRNISLGKSLGFNSTPILILPNGRIIQGSVPSNVIERELGF